MHLPRPRRPRARGAVLGIVTALMLAFPLGVLAGATFNDVPESHPFYNDVEALVGAGVTSGCGGGNYCPNQAVTRGQMAAFMNRLGALGSDKTPVVRAKSVDGWSMGCPSNTVYSQGKCFDNATRGTATDIYDAADSCADIVVLGGHSWHLPGALELRAIRGISGITLNTEWSSTEFYDDLNDWQGFRVSDDGSLTPTDDLVDAPYRCATYPYSQDFTFIFPLTEESGPATEGGASE